ncbi:MAG TPA: farnesyl diphosphate synthase [Aestuariivirgaceae bacterium]|jgi:farnesyl diphosphate synthase|nr:farnesyl diphosphate synthase [Aestuariivirgaceae bacterium]
MNFETALKRTAAEVDRLLDRILPLDTARAPRVIEAMRYASIGQGKRIRPFFVTESARILDAPAEGALRTGVALECVHCYSLVHDDLPAMDDDDLRRGKPTCHKAFDEATAILAGDGLLTLAFDILADPLTHADPRVRVELIANLARAAGHAGMVGGQMLDLEAERQSASDLGQIILMQSLKTGALFRYSLEAGAIVAEASSLDRAALVTFADKIGLAFQIADDVLDIESTPEKLGKATQKDRSAGKATFIDHLGLDGAKARANALTAEAIAALDRFGDRGALLAEAARFIVERKN